MSGNIARVVAGLALLLALLLVSNSQLVRSPHRVQRHSALPASPPETADVGATLAVVRKERATLGGLLKRTKAAVAEAKKAVKRQADAKAEAAAQAEPAATDIAEESAEAEALERVACPATCERHGNCNELTGECNCPLTHRGAACQTPTMPACEVDDDGRIINLSYMASEAFWWMLRDVRVDDERRRKPLHRWLGVLPCECVRQAVAVFSLQNTPSPAEWPEYIGHLELAMQRVLCVDTPRRAAELWEAGGTLPYAYVPVVAWLKSYPAHSPQLLPDGAVHEDDYIAPKDKHIMRLPSRAPNQAPKGAPGAGMPGAPPRAVALGTALPALGTPRLLPLARCGARRCHRAGFCAEWHGAAGLKGKPQAAGCHCLSALAHDTERVRREAGRFAPRRDGECEPPRAPAWREGDERARRVREPADYAKFDALTDHLGPDRWRIAQPVRPRTKACPNECLGRGACAFGFCHCRRGYWGLDCGWSLERAKQLARTPNSPRIYVYEVPSALRRSCGAWCLPEDLGDRLLLSPNLEPLPQRADLFWIYGCPNGDTVLPTLRWIKRELPHWNESVREGVPRHVVVVGHEEGWAEVWQLLGRWFNGNGDHANHKRGWDDARKAVDTAGFVVAQPLASGPPSGNRRLPAALHAPMEPPSHRARSQRRWCRL